MEALLSKIYFCISSPQTTKDLFSVIVEDNAAIKTLCWNDFWNEFTFSFLNRMIQKLDGLAVWVSNLWTGLQWDPLLRDLLTRRESASHWLFRISPRAHLLLPPRWGALWRWTPGKWRYCEENGSYNAIFFLVIQAQNRVSREESLSSHKLTICQLLQQPVCLSPPHR